MNSARTRRLSFLEASWYLARGGGKEFPFHRLSDFSAPEAASHLLGRILF